MSPRKIRGHWCADFRLYKPGEPPQRIRQKSPVNTRKGAAAFERQLQESALSMSGGSAPSAPTLATFAEEFLATYAANNNKFSEIESKESILSLHLIPGFKDKRLDEIDELAIEKYKASKLAGKRALSPKTINNHLTVLRTLLDTARTWKKLATVPDFKWCKVPVQKFDFLTFDEARLLVDAAEGIWKPMILVAVRTGLRQGELLGLQGSDIVGRKLLVSAAITRNRYETPKNNKQREVPLSDEAFAALTELRVMNRKNRYLFSLDTKEPLTKGKCRVGLYHACDKAGLRRVGWHVLRHTFASHLAMRGVALKVIQELLGHSTVEMTMRYAHLSPAVKDSAVSLLDQG